jgi:protein-disulfide isomerase
MIQFFKNLFAANIPKDNAVIAAVQLIRALGIRATATETERRLKWSPAYPSLHSLQSLFTQWQVESLVLEVDHEKLDELPQVFLCHTYANGGEFRVVVQHSGDKVVWLDREGVRQQVQKSDFIQAWSGIVLLAENNPEGGMTGYAAARRLEWWGRYAVPLTLIGWVVFTLAAQVFTPGISLKAAVMALLLQTLNMIGLGIGIALLQYQVNDMHPAAKQLCGLGGQQQDCSKVLKSAASTIFGITWSEIGFSWFAGSSLFVLLAGATPLHALLCYAAVLFIPYSLYYQRRVAKQWCSICLLVLLLVTLQAVVYASFTGFAAYMQVTVIDGIRYAACLLLPFGLWYAVKKMAAERVALQLAEQDYFRLKHNPAVFDLLQAHEKTAEVNTASPVVLNPDGDKAVITLVSSPNCTPCGEAHALVEKTARLHPQVRFNIVFVTSTDEADSTHQPVKHLLAIAKHQGNEPFMKAMHYWYETAGKEYKVFDQAFPYQPSQNGVEQRMEKMEQWVLQNNITATPTYFVNGKKLPDNYGIEDIMVMVANL